MAADVEWITVAPLGDEAERYVQGVIVDSHRAGYTMVPALDHGARWIHLVGGLSVAITSGRDDDDTSIAIQNEPRACKLTAGMRDMCPQDDLR